MFGKASSKKNRHHDDMIEKKNYALIFILVISNFCYFMLGHLDLYFLFIVIDWNYSIRLWR